MGTAPNGWQTPKTDWQAADAPGPSDFNRIEGNAYATELGQRTIDPTQTPTGVVGTLRQFLDWFANRIKAITGKTNWYDAPPTTLTATKSHIDAAAPHSGHATTTALTAHTSAAAPHSGHATTTALTAHTSAAAPHSGHETPAGAQARVDAHAALTAAHSATSDATANRIILRDANGRAKVAAPVAADDIARKDTVDAKFDPSSGHKHTGAAGDGPKLDPATGLTWTPARIAAGSYTGDGTSDRVIVVGFRPKFLYIAGGDRICPGADTGGGFILRSANVGWVITTSHHLNGATAYVSLIDNGFTVSSSGPNSDGQGYSWVAWT